MNMKKFSGLLICLTIAGLCLAIFIQDLQHRPADTAVLSPSNKFLIESVPVSGVLMPFGGMSYLRFTDLERPSYSYRTPLYKTQHVDMRTYEDIETVGVYWMEFSKQGRHFTISAPEWQENWLNVFISNTRYEVIEN
jgi:hypothetical protein